MQYEEYLPSPFFSKFIECFWKLSYLETDLYNSYEVFAPDCTFDLVFSATPFHLCAVKDQKLITIPAGASLIGQKTSSVFLKFPTDQKLFGIRFKPFALVNILPISMASFTDKVLPLSNSSFFSKVDSKCIAEIIHSDDFMKQAELAENLLIQEWEEKLCIDENFRAQLNFILNRKGIIKIKDLFDEFGISKVTLNKHFSFKMGISPKKVSRIWRINYFLQLHKKAQDTNLTQLGLEAGFYDQAHFIKEFKAFFHYSPSIFFQRPSHLLNISQGIINRRFTNQYDPRA